MTRATPLGILTLSRDITGLRTTQAQLQQEQHYDSLTGLLKLSHFLQTSRHLGARKASLLLVDLQHFRGSTIASASGSPTAC